MMTRQELKGQWNEVCGRLKERWGELADSELNRAEGNIEQLVGIVQQQTGAGRREIEDYVEGILEDGSSTVNRFAEKATAYSEEAVAAASEACRSASRNVRESVAQAEGTVRQRPMESLATAFGVGLVSGVLVSLMLRNR